MPTNFREDAGTFGFMAPEVVCNHNHGQVSDVFAIGVIVYEIMIG